MFGRSSMSVYLAGPINGKSEEEAKGWRDRLKSSEIEKVSFRDPMVRDYRGVELDEGMAAEIVEGDKRDIGFCDLVLVMYPGPSVGTAMEVLFAWEMGISVVVIDVSGKPLSPWMQYHACKVLHSLEEAESYLRKEGERYDSNTER